MAKNPLYVDKIVISGSQSDGGVFMADGTSVIDSSGNIDAPVTSTNLTLSGTLSVTGASTLTGAVGTTADLTVGTTLDVTGTTTLSGAVIADSTTTSSGAGAVAITGTIHEVTTTGTGDALTLADGAEGQHLFVAYVAEGAGGDTAVLTPTNLAGANTTVTFTDLGDAAHLLFTAGAWYFVGGEAAVA